MTYQVWHDQITGARYRCSEAWLNWVRAHLVAQLGAKLQGVRDIRTAANRVAHFWRIDYYEQLFPLRFGRSKTPDKLFFAPQLFEMQPEIPLETTRPLRQEFLDEAAWPPLLPDPTKGKDGWLLADRLLIEAALINVLLTANTEISEDVRQATRLAALTYPFREELQQLPCYQGQVYELSQLFHNPVAAARHTTPLYKIISTVRTDELSALQEYNVGLVLVAAKRIKEYVFETHGLNEIRGASELLNKITAELQRQVEKLHGPEVVLRAAGSTLIFLTSANAQLVEWPPQLRKAFFAQTGVAFPAAAAISVSAAELLHNFSDTIGSVFRLMDEDRALARLPRHVTYPFEARCALCQTRAANTWDDTDPEQTARLICDVCLKKRLVGLPEKREELNQMLVHLGMFTPSETEGALAQLGVKGTQAKEWIAKDLSELIPPLVRRRLIGVVYGDGNNFGAVSLGLPDMALGLQWEARVEQTTRAAAALALGRATQLAAQQYDWRPGKLPILEKLPFQVLALGGDDLSLFAWGPVAMYFAAEFTRLTDVELASVSVERLRPKADLNFSLGVLLTDENTPVRKSVNFTERGLLKWAKQANKKRELNCGTITMLYAEKADKVPADLDRYRAEMYLLGLGRQFQLCATLRPYTAAELTALLTVAEKVLVQGHLGRLQRLISAFYGARHGAFAGMLHYAYQKGRFKDGGWIAELERELLDNMKTHVPSLASALLIDYRTADKNGAKRTPFGVAQGSPPDGGPPPIVRFSPLWDLLELAKLLS